MPGLCRLAGPLKRHGPARCRAGSQEEEEEKQAHPLLRGRGSQCLPAMPELPEVEVIRRALAATIVGRTVVAVRGRSVRLREPLEPSEWRRLAVGRSVTAVERRGKSLIVSLPPAVALLHLGMSGRILVQPPGRRPLPHTHLRLLLDGGLELRLVDPRRFGLAVISDDPAVIARRLAGLGPEPWDENWCEALVAAAGRSRVAIRNLLLDQRVVAGVGNIYANEALARAGIHPLRPARGIAPARIRTLAGEIRDVLTEAVAAGGTTLEDGGFVDTAGEGGAFAVELRVYGREGQPCSVCGTPIRRVTASARSAFLCPCCQR